MFLEYREIKLFLSCCFVPGTNSKYLEVIRNTQKWWYYKNPCQSGYFEEKYFVTPMSSDMIYFLFIAFYIFCNQIVKKRIWNLPNDCTADHFQKRVIIFFV